jgi:hypothetical protein
MQSLRSLIEFFTVSEPQADQAKGGAMPTSTTYEADLSSYAQFARAAAAQEGPATFLNRHAEHGWIIADLLFTKANSCVEILSGTLNPEIYGDDRVVRSAISFLDRCPIPTPFEPSLLILVERSGDWNSHPLISRVVATFPRKLEVRYVPEEIRSTYQFHFMLSDEKHFRCKLFRESREAFIEFNSVGTGDSLHKLFQQIRLKSNIVDLGA